MDNFELLRQCKTLHYVEFFAEQLARAESLSNNNHAQWVLIEIHDLSRETSSRVSRSSSPVPSNQCP